MFYAITNYTRITNTYSSWFDRLGFIILTKGFVDSTIIVGTISTSLFLLWHVSIKWSILPQLVHVRANLAITTNTVGLIIILAYGVVNRTL